MLKHKKACYTKAKPKAIAQKAALHPGAQQDAQPEGQQHQTPKLVITTHKKHPHITLCGGVCIYPPK